MIVPYLRFLLALSLLKAARRVLVAAMAAAVLVAAAPVSGVSAAGDAGFARNLGRSRLL